jgi:hypothetical protein
VKKQDYNHEEEAKEVSENNNNIKESIRPTQENPYINLVRRTPYTYSKTNNEISLQDTKQRELQGNNEMTVKQSSNQEPSISGTKYLHSQHGQKLLDQAAIPNSQDNSNKTNIQTNSTELLHTYHLPNAVSPRTTEQETKRKQPQQYSSTTHLIQHISSRSAWSGKQGQPDITILQPNRKTNTGSYTTGIHTRKPSSRKSSSRKKP